jgi:hypothetical protein
VRFWRARSISGQLAKRKKSVLPERQGAAFNAPGTEDRERTATMMKTVALLAYLALTVLAFSQVCSSFELSTCLGDYN